MELKEIIQQIEELEGKRTDIGEEIKFIYQKAKAEGFNEKAIKRLIQARKKNPQEVTQEEEHYEKYKKEIGF